MIKKYLGTLLLILTILIGLGAAGYAALDDTPSNSVLNPVTQTLYFADNATPQLKVYTWSGATWNAAAASYKALPAGSVCYGLAVNAAGNKLYVAVNNGTSSDLRVYTLDASGLPTTYESFGKPTGTAYPTSASPAGLALNETNNRLYLADKGRNLIYIFNTSTRAYVGFLSGISDPHFGLAIGGSKLFVSNKATVSKIHVYTIAADGALTYSMSFSTVDNTFPTYMKVVGTKLYVAVKGIGGVDIKVYNTASPYSHSGSVSNPDVSALYGWTSFDIVSGRLIYKKARNADETSNSFYSVLTADISTTGGTTAAPRILDSVIASDGLAVSSALTRAAASNSKTGACTIYDLTTTPIANHTPTVEQTSLKQYKLNGTTEIAKGGTTNENRIIVKFRPLDADAGDILKATIQYRTLPGGIWGTKEVTGITPGTTTSATLPATGNFTNGNYEWRVKVRDVASVESAWYIFGSDANATDFVVSFESTDVTSPAAISTLSAAVGTNAGEVNLTWTAVGDDGTTGTATSYILKYSLTGPITTEALFNSATTYTQSWVPAAAGATENKILTGLAPQGEQIWLSIKARDEVPNTGPLGNCAATIIKNNVEPPVITKVYPQKGPNNIVNHIVIRGSNLYNDMTAAIVSYDGLTSTPLTNVHQDSSTMVQADIPSGLAVGNYEITITCPGGTYADAAHANPNNDFEMVAPGSDTTAPATVQDFTAADNQDGQSTLTWTNPADVDLREIVVRRKTTGYPANHSDGDQVYQTSIPEFGTAETQINNGLTNGTTYYYAVFSRDTSDNWNNSVDSTLPGVSADTAIPGTGGDEDPITTITIIHDVTDTIITWETTTPGAGVDIYRLQCDTNASGEYTSYYTTNVANWGAPIATNNTSGTYTITNSVGTGNAQYFKLVATGQPLTAAALTYEVVGKFDVAVGDSAVEPQKFFISAPLVLTDSSLASVIGSQVGEMDMILTFDINKNVVNGSIYQTGAWGIFPGAVSEITSVEPGMTYGYYSSAAKFITMVGRIRETDYTRSLDGGATLVANWLGNPYPIPMGIASAGLNGSSASTDPSLAAMAYQFDANAELIGGINGIAFHTAASEWMDGSLSSPATLQLVPGRGYMLTEPVQNTFGWNMTKPY